MFLQTHSVQALAPTFLFELTGFYPWRMCLCVFAIEQVRTYQILKLHLLMLSSLLHCRLQFLVHIFPLKLHHHFQWLRQDSLQKFASLLIALPFINFKYCCQGFDSVLCPLGWKCYQWNHPLIEIRSLKIETCHVSAFKFENMTLSVGRVA